MKKYLNLLIAIGFALFPAFASAAPSLPMSFWGTATVNGSNVPVGTVIKAYNSSGVVYDTVTVTTAGLYGTDSLSGANPAEDRLLFEGTGTITFKAIISGYDNGAEVTAAETETFSAGTAERFDLTFAATADTGTCSPSSVSNGTVAAYPSCTITCNTGYYLSGTSCLVSGGGGGGGGGGSGDMTPPSITNIVATPTSGTTTVITWQTNESSFSWVLYGTTTSYGQQVKTSSYVTSHSVTLTGLTASTTYHYQIKSQDPVGNVGTYTDKTFTTLASGQTAAAPAGSGSGSGSSTTTKPISQMTREELIAFILQLIAAMQNSGATGGSISGIPSGFTFNTNLYFGMDMTDIKYLQIVLNSNADTKVSLTGPGSSGNETTRFGSATLAAVKKFQVKYGIANAGNAGYGLVGPATRAKLNSLLGK